jgi:hypothetical protein
VVQELSLSVVIGKKRKLKELGRRTCCVKVDTFASRSLRRERANGD